MGKVIDIFKGALMGIANVIPGLSGGTIAVAIGIYEKLISALADVIKTPIKVIKSIWPIVLGLVIGIIFSVLGVTYMLEHYEVPSTMLFVGFILGSLPIVIKEVEHQKIRSRDIIAFLIMMALVIILPIFELFGITATTANMNPILLVLIGIVAAATMIVPGVSGSMVLMTIGYYDNIMNTISNCILALKDFNISQLVSNVLILIPFGIGVLVGIILMAKLMKWLISKYKNTTNWAILGLIVASPFAIITNINLAGAGILQIICSILTFIVGYALALYVCKLDEKLPKKEGTKNEK